MVHLSSRSNGKEIGNLHGNRATTSQKNLCRDIRLRERATTDVLSEKNLSHQPKVFHDGLNLTWRQPEEPVARSLYAIEVFKSMKCIYRTLGDTVHSYPVNDLAITLKVGKWFWFQYRIYSTRRAVGS